MSALTSTGLGSGLDINSIVGAIVGAEKDPALAKITTETADATAKISAYGLLNSELSSFKSSYKDLGYASSFAAATMTSSDSEILDATLGFGATTGQWEFEVTQRAQAHTLVSAEANQFAEVTDSIGEGLLTLTFGRYSTSAEGEVFTANTDKPAETITISNTIDPATGKNNNSLEGLRDEINDKDNDYSVSASIINDGSNYRLILTSKDTGEQSAVEISATDLEGGAISAGTGLDRFSYGAQSKNMTQTVVAQDAQITMNGISIGSASNHLDNVLEGVTLNINAAEAGKTVKLKIDRDTSKVEEQVNAFVENYNNTIKKMNELTTYNGAGAEGNGALNGDSTIRTMETMMRSVLNTQENHLEGSIHSFADLGMLTARDGTLELDAVKLSGALNSDMAGVAEFFTATGIASDADITFESNNSFTKPGMFPINITQVATQGSAVATLAPNLSIGSEPFKININGYESNDIQLSAGSYATVDALAAELQSKINADAKLVEGGANVAVVNEGGSLAITSTKYGSTSSITFSNTEADIISDLGFSGATHTRGVNVAGEIGGEVARGSGQQLSSSKGDSSGIKLLVEGGEVGARGNVAYSEGMAKMMNNVLEGIIDRNISESKSDTSASDGVIDGKVDSLYKQIAILDNNKESLTYRMDKLEARLYKNFNAMDTSVSNLNGTMSYLQSSLDALPGYGRD